MSKSMTGKVKLDISKCLDELLNVCDSYYSDDEEEDEVFELLFNYLNKRNKKRLKAKLCETHPIPKILDEYNVAALMGESGIKIWQWRKINQCLRLFMDVKRVAVAESRLRELGAGHGEIKHGTYHFSDPKKPGNVKELCRYWTKDPVFEFLQVLEGIINGHGLTPDNIKYIHICHGGDHGKGKFRFGSKLLLCVENGGSFSEVYGLADVECKKDHPLILDNTVMPHMIRGVNRIEAGTVVFSRQTNTNGESYYVLSLTPLSDIQIAGTYVIRPTSYIAGDLACLCYFMGKSNFSSAWCNWCKVAAYDWQAKCSTSIDNDDML